MRKLLMVTTLSTTAAVLTAAALLGFWAVGTGPHSARANHAVTLGLDLDPSGVPANAPASLGSIEDCLDVTAGQFDDDGDTLFAEDPIDGLDNDGDTLYDEDPPGQLFNFDVWITDVGHDLEPGLEAFSIPLQYDGAVTNIVDVDVTQFLAAQGHQVLDGSDPTLPDSDGLYTVAAADISDPGPGPLNTGSGVLARVTGVAVAAGLSAVDIAKVDLNGDTILDWGPYLLGSDSVPIGDTVPPPSGDTFFDGPLSGGTVAVDQPDSDGDGASDVCDTDTDNDGVDNDVDNCPTVANGPAEASIPRVGNQTDTDSDGSGDACDIDIDGDGFLNDREDFYASDATVFASTIEVCDGVDNDADTTVDEDGLDHDNDGLFDDPNIDCVPGAPDTEDFDGDGFAKKAENWMATDIYDDCADNSNDPALSPDINNNASINIGDVIAFGPSLLTSLGNPAYDRRFDMNADTNVNIGDVLNAFLGRILTSCTP